MIIGKSVISLTIIFSLVYGSSRLAYGEDRESSHLSHSGTTSSMIDDDGDDSSGTTNQTALISPGFRLKISSSTDSKLNGSFRVSIDGKVALPYDQSLTAAGLSLKGFQKKLESTYQPYFKGRPNIKVVIQQRRYWVKVLGVVRNPGNYLVKEHTSLDEVLANASVKTEDLPTGYVRITHDSHSRMISMDDYLRGGPDHDLPPWTGGEQIIFQIEKPERETASAGEDPMGPSARKIQVLGEVKNPGTVSYQRSGDGLYYIIQRGGPTHDSDLSKVELIRTDPKTNTHSRVSIGDLGNIKNVQESDVIIVHPERQTGFERGLQNTGIIATIISAIVLTVFVAKK